MNWGNSGLVPGDIREEREDEMTEARPWPNSAIEMRNQAAERIARAAATLDKALESPKDIEVIIRGIYAARLDLAEALRWLESAGAPTRPISM